MLNLPHIKEDREYQQARATLKEMESQLAEAERQEAALLAEWQHFNEPHGGVGFDYIAAAEKAVATGETVRTRLFVEEQFRACKKKVELLERAIHQARHQLEIATLHASQRAGDAARPQVLETVAKMLDACRGIIAGDSTIEGYDTDFRNLGYDPERFPRCGLPRRVVLEIQSFIARHAEAVAKLTPAAAPRPEPAGPAPWFGKKKAA